MVAATETPATNNALRMDKHTYGGVAFLSQFL